MNLSKSHRTLSAIEETHGSVKESCRSGPVVGTSTGLSAASTAAATSNGSIDAEEEAVTVPTAANGADRAASVQQHSSGEDVTATHKTVRTSAAAARKKAKQHLKCNIRGCRLGETQTPMDIFCASQLAIDNLLRKLLEMQTEEMEDKKKKRKEREKLEQAKRKRTKFEDYDLNDVEQYLELADKFKTLCDRVGGDKVQVCMQFPKFAETYLLTDEEKHEFHERQQRQNMS